MGDEQFSSVQRSVFDSTEVDTVHWTGQLLGGNRGGGEGNLCGDFFFVKTGTIFNTGKDVGIPQLMCKVRQGERGLCGVVGWILRLAVLALGCECCLAPGWS